MKGDRKIIDILNKAFLLVIPALLIFAGVLRADTVVAKSDKVVIQTYVGDKNREVRGYLAKGDRAAVFNKSSYTAVMDGQEGYWYFIQTSTGLSGWAFGGSLTFETSASGFKLVDVEQITDGSKEIASPTLSSDGNFVAFAQKDPETPNVYNIFTYDMKTKKVLLVMSTRYLIGPNFSGLFWQYNGNLVINMSNGIDRSYDIECPLATPAGLPVKENVWLKGMPDEKIRSVKLMYRKESDLVKYMDEHPGQLPPGMVMQEDNGRYLTCYADSKSKGHRFIPEIRVLDLKDNSVSSIPFWVSRTSAPWEGALDGVSFGYMGSHILMVYPHDSDTTRSVDRVWSKSVEHLFDVSAPVIQLISLPARNDILYVVASLPLSPGIKIYKYSEGSPLKLVVPSTEGWMGAFFSADGHRVLYVKLVDGKKALFIATVKE